MKTLAEHPGEGFFFASSRFLQSRLTVRPKYDAPWSEGLAQEFGSQLVANYVIQSSISYRPQESMC
jgi:hypothetical protein